MYSGLILALVISLCVIFFLIYKRHMITNLFSLNMSEQVDTFEKDIQNTANLAVDKMSDASEELSQLLAQAEETIEELKIRIKIAEEQLYKNSLNEIKQNVKYKIPDNKNTDNKSNNFAKHLIKATYQTANHLDEEEQVVNPHINNILSKVKPSQVKIVDNKNESENLLQAKKELLETAEHSKIETLHENESNESTTVTDFPSLYDVDISNADPKVKQKEILTLVAEGYDDAYIAKTLRLGIAEVKLTRKLKEK